MSNHDGRAERRIAEWIDGPNRRHALTAAAGEAIGQVPVGEAARAVVEFGVEERGERVVRRVLEEHAVHGPQQLSGLLERDRAQEALRASERVARSHVEVMMRSLDVLATESAPEKFIGEMLRTIGQHLRALRVLLFLRNPQDGTVRMHLVIEDDRQVT